LRRGRLFTSGSAPLPAADMRRFEALTGQQILERYGMSETLITLSNPHDGERRAGSVGQPVPGCEIRVVDDNMREVVDEPGEILVLSNGIMSGYWNMPEADSKAFAGDWFRTGDVAIRGADGYVRIVGRKSVDIIKSGGFKISAREIEDALREHPAVADVAVVGLPDPTWGERIVAAVVTAGDPSPGLEDALIGHVAGVLADFKKPREIRLISELPRNALGKVQKHRLKEQFTASTAAPDEN
jgi:acyl-CoA synthetase (AMP-forming)/AMP-acid ligase II